MAVQIALLIAGFALLVKGGDLLVLGASSLARAWGVSDLAIGLTIVAFGTSVPELVISLLACAKGSVEICIANVVGSNIANIFLIVGVSSIIFPLFATRGTVWKEIPFLMLASIVFALLTNDRLLNQAESSVLTRGDGLVLLSFFAIFLYYVGQLIANAPPEADVPVTEGRQSGKAATVRIALGLAMLVLGGNWAVGAAVQIAQTLHVSENMIGLTVVAMGTSLPELAASGMAAWRRKPDIAFGNIVGSSVFNILLVVGMSSVARPLPVSADAVSDIVVMLLAASFLFVAMFVGKPRRQVSRLEGAAFVCMYVGYIAWVVVRG